MDEARLPSIDELVAAVESRTHEPSAAARLRAAIELGGRLEAMSDDLIGRFVMEARAAGLSWTEVGQVFGTSKQAVQQRYGALLAQPGAWPGRWSAAAGGALDRAGDEARRLGHDHVGTEHALLALALAEEGLAAEVLARLGVTPERILATSCMQAPPRAHDARAGLAVMPRLKQALEHTRRIADGLGTPVADTEHLLAGLVAVPDSMAVAILRRLKTGPDRVRAALGDRLGVDQQRLGAPHRRRRRLLTASR